LSCLHFAAQKKEGIISIYFLKDHYKEFDPNVPDIFDSIPLHHAILGLEELNI